MLSIEELEELLDKIRVRLTIANRNGTLNQILQSLNMLDLITPQFTESNKKGKIVLLGATDVNTEILLMTAGKLGIDKNRLEMCLDYDALQKYDYRKLQYLDKYRVVLVGPMPHSAKDKGDSGSIISEIESRPDFYPRVVRMGIDGNLKITKSGFKNVLNQLIQEKYI